MVVAEKIVNPTAVIMRTFLKNSSFNKYEMKTLMAIINREIRLGIVKERDETSCASPSGSPYRRGTCGGKKPCNKRMIKMIIMLTETAAIRGFLKGMFSINAPLFLAIFSSQSLLTLLLGK